MLIEWFKKVHKRFQLLVRMNDVLIDNNEALQNATNEAEAYYKQREVDVSRREGELDKREAQLESALTRESVVNNTYQAVQELTPVIMGKIDMVAQQLQHITILPVATVYGRLATFLGIFVIALLVLLGGAITTAFVYRDANKTLRAAAISGGEAKNLLGIKDLELKNRADKIQTLQDDKAVLTNALWKLDPQSIANDLKRALKEQASTIESDQQLTNSQNQAGFKSVLNQLNQLSQLSKTLVAEQEKNASNVNLPVKGKGGVGTPVKPTVDDKEGKKEGGGDKPKDDDDSHLRSIKRPY